MLLNQFTIINFYNLINNLETYCCNFLYYSLLYNTNQKINKIDV